MRPAMCPSNSTSTTTNAFQPFRLILLPPAMALRPRRFRPVNSAPLRPKPSRADPDASHCDIVCNTRYMLNTLTWTDDYGSGTGTYFRGSWQGSYTYTSNHLC